MFPFQTILAGLKPFVLLAVALVVLAVIIIVFAKRYDKIRGK